MHAAADGTLLQYLPISDMSHASIASEGKEQTVVLDKHHVSTVMYRTSTCLKMHNYIYGSMLMGFHYSPYPHCSIMSMSSICTHML